MTQKVLDLSGTKGFADNFFGDSDIITPDPSARVSTAEGEMAQGLFNPYLRKGYMLPTTITSLPVTGAGTKKITSWSYDETDDQLFLGEFGEKIYTLDDPADSTLTEAVSLPTGSIIQDLEIYNLRTSRHLYYLYSKPEALEEFKLSGRGTWKTISAKVEPSGSVTPAVLTSYSEQSGLTVRTLTVDVPTGSNISCLIFIVRPTALTSITIDGNAMTLVKESATVGVSTATVLWGGLYARGNVGSGSKTIVITGASSQTTGINIVFVSNSAATPVTETYAYTGMSSTPILQSFPESNHLLLSFLLADRPYGEVRSLNTIQSYDENVQTGGNGFCIAVRDDGTSFYINGGTGAQSIYQYTMGTAFTVTTATYASKTINVSAQISAPGMLNLSSDGTKMILGDSVYSTALSAYRIRLWNLGTAWDLATATFDATKDFPLYVDSRFNAVRGVNLSPDGKHLYIVAAYLGSKTAILHFNLATAWLPNTATFSEFIELDTILDLTGLTPASISLGSLDTTLILSDGNSGLYFSVSFDPRFPYDVSKIKTTTSTAGSIDSFTDGTNTLIGNMHVLNNYIYYRRNAGGSAGGDVTRRAFADGSRPSIVKTGNFITSAGTTILPSMVLYTTPGNLLECGVARLPLTSTLDSTWLTTKTNTYLMSPAKYNFIRKSDNGFAYLFAGNTVNKIDGGVTGGDFGTITKNVLLFPSNFTITDAIDYRSKLYIALNQYPVDSSISDLRVFQGSCGIFIWDRLSTTFGGTDYIEIPGMKEIKKIYSSPDGVIKVLGVGNSGLTELRKFGYNDSGGAVFRLIKTLGIGAFPQFPDGLSLAGEIAMWVGNDGAVYSEKGYGEIQTSIHKLHQIKIPGTTTQLVNSNIESGVLVSYGGEQTVTGAYRSNRQAVLVTYKDGASNIVEKIYPFDLTTGSNSAQVVDIGNAFTTVELVPITSTLRQVRVYNKPVVSIGTTVIASVKLYFNQSKTVSMVKSITFDEAKRGYVDFSINKPYLHSLQIEIEWTAGRDLNDDTYMPSIAVISYDESNTKSPDNG